MQSTSQFIRSFRLLALALGFVALAPETQAVNPPPPGAYPNGNTAAGEQALFNLDTSGNGLGGYSNVAVGWRALYSNATGDHNTAIGQQALFKNEIGIENVAVGNNALAFNNGSFNTASGYGALADNRTGSYNTAAGYHSLFSNNSGTQNTANGALALLFNTGSYNTATGFSALTKNTTGNSNTAHGTNSLLNNTTGTLNVAVGDRALASNTSGNENTATGGAALNANTTGFHNTATGAYALYSNITGRANVAQGVYALDNNTTGNYNTADGYGALSSNTSGYYNAATGSNALFRTSTGRSNTAHGVSALYFNTTGSNNIALGFSAGRNLTTGSNNIVIGHAGVAAQANTIRIGTQGVQSATYIAGIRGATVPGGISVFVDANGRLGTVTSSERFKEEIMPMEKDSEAILQLKPVTFRYKQELDPDGIAQFGLVAEEVEKINPALVARDETGKAYTVRYEAVNAMLLNEFIKEHRKGKEREATIAHLKSKLAKQETIDAEQQQEIKSLAATLKEQASLIQKVSAQLQIRQPARQVALLDQ